MVVNKTALALTLIETWLLLKVDVVISAIGGYPSQLRVVSPRGRLLPRGQESEKNLPSLWSLSLPLGRARRFSHTHTPTTLAPSPPLKEPAALRDSLLLTDSRLTPSDV